MTDERNAPRKTCTDHCAACGQHFHVLGAFDAHQAGGYCNDASEVVYQSGNREGKFVLQPWTDTGCCDKEPGCWQNGRRLAYVENVTVWQVAPTEKQLEGLQRLVTRKSDAQAVLL